MRDDDTPLLNEGTASSSRALLPVGTVERRNGDWSNASALMQPAAPTAPDLMVYVHAIRRYWLMSAGIGLLCAAVAGPAVWFGVGAKYTAQALLSVAMQEKPIAFQMEVSVADKDRFDIYKSTQTQLVTSRFVLLAALRNPSWPSSR